MATSLSSAWHVSTSRINSSGGVAPSASTNAT